MSCGSKCSAGLPHGVEWASLQRVIMVFPVHTHLILHPFTVLPAKSDSDVLFVYEVIRDLESIDHLCINPIHRIGLIHR